MDPVVRHPAINEFLDNIAGTDVSLGIKENRCVDPPIGCGRKLDPNKEWEDEASEREYAISGLCQSCQNAFFNSEDEEDF